MAGVTPEQEPDRALADVAAGRVPGGFTMVPNVLLDSILPDLSGAECRVLLYLWRHTAGFHRTSQVIPLQQVCTGAYEHDRDRGTGLARSTARMALDALVERGYVTRVRRGRGKGQYTVQMDSMLAVSQRGRSGIAGDPLPAALTTEEHQPFPASDARGDLARVAAGEPVHALPAPAPVRTPDMDRTRTEPPPVRKSDVEGARLGPPPVRKSDMEWSRIGPSSVRKSDTQRPISGQPPVRFSTIERPISGPPPVRFSTIERPIFRPPLRKESV